MVDMIKKWWKNAKMSPIEKYLSESSNLADLERRQRQLQIKNFKL
tara:strand:+ start:887 stop:1021 length:135 start_codon:yes stop_codon:yes gene_type:complete